MRWCPPSEEALQSILEDEDYSNPTVIVSKFPSFCWGRLVPCVETAEVVGH